MIRLLITCQLCFLSGTVMANSSRTVEDISVIAQINNTDNSVTLSQIDSNKIATITATSSDNDIVNGNIGNQNVVNSTADTNSFSVYQRGNFNEATVTGDSGSVVIRQIGSNNISTVSQ